MPRLLLLSHSAPLPKRPSIGRGWRRDHSSREAAVRGGKRGQGRAALSNNDIPIPELEPDLQEVQASQGARFGRHLTSSDSVSASSAGQVLTDGIEAVLDFSTQQTLSEEVDAARGGAALVDISHYTRIRVEGEGVCDFLQSKLTCDIQSMTSGQRKPSLLLAADGTVVDIADVLLLSPKSALLLSSPLLAAQSEAVGAEAYISSQIFPLDKVSISNIENETSVFVLCGPEADDVLCDLLDDKIALPKQGEFGMISINGSPILLAQGTGLRGLEGWTLVVDSSGAAEAWDTIISAEATPSGALAWEALRIMDAQPRVGTELGVDLRVNKNVVSKLDPIHADLMELVSTEKGCFVGQERLKRRMKTPNRKGRLYHITLSQPTTCGSTISLNGDQIGVITSVTSSSLPSLDNKYAALAVLSTGDVTEGTDVEVESCGTGTLSLREASSRF